jgi:hypothetical protein
MYFSRPWWEMGGQAGTVICPPIRRVIMATNDCIIRRVMMAKNDCIFALQQQLAEAIAVRNPTRTLHIQYAHNNPHHLFHNNINMWMDIILRLFKIIFKK